MRPKNKKPEHPLVKHARKCSGWELLAPLDQSITRVFRLMEIAEEEIAASGLHEDRDVFMLLEPSPVLCDKDTLLYRAHAREILTRVRAGEDTAPGTKAEVLAALSDASLVAPPGQTFAALFERLFAEVFGRVIDGQPAREQYPGASDELLATARRKLRRDRLATMPESKPSKRSRRRK